MVERCRGSAATASFYAMQGSPMDAGSLHNLGLEPAVKVWPRLSLVGIKERSNGKKQARIWQNCRSAWQNYTVEASRHS